MIDLHTYLLFIGAVVVLVIVPGPDMAYMLARTIAQGQRAGVLAAVGINVGAYVHVAAAILGLSAVLATSSMAFSAVKWLGACYLIWIGIRAITSKSGPLNVAVTGSVQLNRRAIFWQGFLSDVLNPKVAIFFLAFLPQFVDVNNHAISVTHQLLVLGVTSNVVAICINLLLVLFAGAATNSFRKNQRVVTWLNKIMGAVFVTLGIRLANEKL
jgi:threonine/homoserine/homoserine lactone efflux protein